MSRLLRSLAAVVAASLVLLLTLGSGPASADNPHDPSEGVSGSLSTCGAQQAVQTTVLPVSRWTDAMSLHSRLHDVSLGDTMDHAQRSIMVGSMIDLGNTFWNVTTGITEFATRFCVLDKVGGIADHIAGSLMRTFLKSGLIAILVVLALVAALWQSRRQGGAALLRHVGGVVGILALMGVTMAGAMNSTQSGSTYRPGKLSPGWFLTTIDGVVSTAANAVGATVTCTGHKADCTVTGAESGPAGFGNLGCAPYVKALQNQYVSLYANGDIADASAEATTPLLLSKMWESSGLALWKDIQYGDTPVDASHDFTYGDLVYCRQLESQAGIPLVNDGSAGTWAANPDNPAQNQTDQSTLTQRALGANHPYGIDPGKAMKNTLAFSPPVSGNKVNDRQLVGWAACAAPHDDSNGKWLGAYLIHGDSDGGTDDQVTSNCTSFFSDSSFDGNDGGHGSFDWDESDDDVSENHTSTAATDFLLTLHGSTQASAIPQGATYLVAAFCIMIVFLLFAGAIIGAKLMALFQIIAFVFVLLFSLLPGTAGGAKVAQFLKQYLGLSIFAFGGLLLLSLISVMSALMVTVGSGVMPGGPAGLLAQMWTGFSPIIAIFALHHIFKQLRVPSPLKLSSGMAFGAAAAGGAVGSAGLVGMGELMGHARRARALTRRGRNTISTGMGKIGKGGMKPPASEPVGPRGQDTSKIKGAPGNSPQATSGPQTAPETAGPQGTGNGGGPEATLKPVTTQAPSKEPVTAGGPRDGEADQVDGDSSTEETPAPSRAEVKAERQTAREWAKSLSPEARAAAGLGSRRSLRSLTGEEVRKAAVARINRINNFKPTGKQVAKGAMIAGGVVVAGGTFGLAAPAVGALALAHVVKHRPGPDVFGRALARRKEASKEQSLAEVEAYRQHQQAISVPTDSTPANPPHPGQVFQDYIRGQVGGEEAAIPPVESKFAAPTPRRPEPGPTAADYKALITQQATTVQSASTAADPAPAPEPGRRRRVVVPPVHKHEPKR